MRIDAIMLLRSSYARYTEVSGSLGCLQVLSEWQIACIYRENSEEVH